MRSRQCQKEMTQQLFTVPMIGQAKSWSVSSLGSCFLLHRLAQTTICAVSFYSIDSALQSTERAFCHNEMFIRFVCILCVIAVAHDVDASLKYGKNRTLYMNPGQNFQRNGIRFVQVTCQPHTKFLTNCSCNIRQVARERFSMDFRATALLPLNALFANFKLYYQYGEEERLLLNIWADVCGYFSGKVPSLVIDAVVDNLKKYSNMNHTCPFEKEMIFNAERITVNDVVVNKFLPTGRFHLNTTFANGPKREFVGNVKLYFTNLLQ